MRPFLSLITAAVAAAFLLPNTCQAQLMINEVMAANSSTINDPDYDESADWIELYNSGTSLVDLSGYYLTDNISDTTTWSFPVGTFIPAGGYLLVWADGQNTGLHTIFRLSSLGEEVGLYNNSQELEDSLTFPALQTNISYGRSADGSAEWSWFSTSTPGASNNTSLAYEGVTYFQPFFSQTGGFFNAPMTVSLSSLGGTIRYTLDGRAPTELDPVYSEPIAFDTTTFIRARVFQDNYIPGPVVTHSYFYNDTFVERGLPVVSLVTDPDFFWDPEIGLYVQDFKPEWEHALNIELFENDGNNQAAFNQQAGVKINGLYSWQLPQKMLGIYFRNEYAGDLEYPVFPGRDRYSYNEIILRASGSDWSYTLFRDGLCQSLVQENTPMYSQGFRPSIVFINGEYMGIHNIRSRSDGEEIEQLYSFEPGTYDIIANDGEIEEGDDLQFQYMDALFNSDLTNQSNFDLLQETVDLTNFADYWITEMWCSNSSWGHNVKQWKPHGTGKWQYIFGDLDRGFSGSTNDPISGFSVPVGGGNDYDYARYWLQNIFENDDYASYFSQRFADHIYTSFHPQRINDVIDSYSSTIVNEIPYHVERWTGTTSSYGDGIPTVQFWEEQVQGLRDFALTRQSFSMTDIQNTFGMGEIISLGTASLPADGGSIRLNEFTIPGSPWSGPYFADLSFQLTAEPNPGFTFEGWSTYDSAEIFGLGAEWRYLDNGTDAGTSWRELNFDDSSWSQGNGEFGYGDGDEVTTVSYGPDPGNKYITTYFRKSFEYTGDDSYPVSCILNIRRDDGVVVYHNGVEIARSNLPGGNVNYLTTAIEAIGGDGETALTEFLVELPMINGNNVIAVEIHQQNGNSSDISFDASLSILTPSENIISSDTTITLYLGGDAGYIARYIPTGECVLPAVISENTTLTIDCSPYLASGDTYIEPGVSVTVNPGVQIWFPEEARLIVQGDLQVNGTEDMPVLFKANNAYGAGSWGNVSFENCTDVNHLNYLEIKDATEGYHPIHNRAAISGWYSEIVMDHVTLTDNFSNPIFGEYSSFTLTNSLIHSAVTGDLINVKYGDGYISDCVFIGNDQPDTDAIDYDRVVDGVVRNSRIEGFFGFNSDGLDLGEECINILVENCLINDCTDKGISIGQSSTAIAINNTIVNCNLGFGIKDLGVAEIEHLTLYSNVIGIECYEKNLGLGGGFATVTNSIFSNSSQSPVLLDNMSGFTAEQCIYDTDTMPGETNWYLNPEFVSPSFYDFQLQSSSGAIAAGTDGLNLGTLDHSFTADVEIMISAIMYDNIENPDKEYVKIKNAGVASVNLSGYMLSDAFEFLFPEGTEIAPEEEITIVRDATLFTDLTGQVFQWTDGQLNNAGEMIVLKESHGIIIDHVLYDNALPWPTYNDTDQYLALISPMLDNHFASSWILLPEPVQINEVTASGIELFPNPASTHITLMSQIPLQNIQIRDVSGREIFSGNISGMSTTIPVDQFPAGLYLATINHIHQLRFVVKP